jgi:CHAT domain-containing protein/predicted negative regulator of RcsB-dependent stress response
MGFRRSSQLWRAVLLGTAIAWGVLQTSVAASEPSDSPADPSMLRSAVQSASGVQSISARWALADALTARGQLLEAERTLREAAALPEDVSQQRGTALRLAGVLTAQANTEGASEQLALAKSSGKPSATEQLMLDEVEGNLAVRNGDLATAERAFLAETDQARAQGIAASEARARVNALRAHFDRKEISGVEERLQRIEQTVEALPAGQQRTLLELATGELYARAVREFLFPAALRAHAYVEITRAQAETQDSRTQAYAAGLLGQLYQDEGRTGEALQLTLQAIFLAQQAEDTDQLYRWEWQAGRLQRALGDSDGAEKSLDRALFSLSLVREDVLHSSRQAFGTLIEPVYLGYADMHLKTAAALADGSPEQQRALRQVRDELESLKRTEVQDYFESACAANAGASPAINLPGTAVVYPIVLPDRLEVLIESAGILRRFTAPVSQVELTSTVRRLRIALEQPTSREQYLKPAQQLYTWVLAPADPWLKTQKVTTLVFVPDGALRTVPLATFHDGKQFAIERYAVATTPAISLIPTLETSASKRVLLAGITQGVQGFAALPQVHEELHTVGSMFPAEVLEDQKFSLATIRTGLTQPDFSIAHLATHGEFSADHRRSFVLTYDSRLTLDGLQQVLKKRQAPLDLLVLSACSTAAGDDRAALGLAGVAVQSGAKSALASLWSISDEATASLMRVFYKDIKAGASTKAQSLRDAQLALLNSNRFRHPSYWAPYLMIGDWL